MSRQVDLPIASGKPRPRIWRIERFIRSDRAGGTGVCRTLKTADYFHGKSWTLLSGSAGAVHRHPAPMKPDTSLVHQPVRKYSNPQAADCSDVEDALIK